MDIVRWFLRNAYRSGLDQEKRNSSSAGGQWSCAIVLFFFVSIVAFGAYMFMLVGQIETIHYNCLASSVVLKILTPTCFKG